MKQILATKNSEDILYNLAPIEHKWAWDLLDKSLKNHWHPNEIGIGNDILAFQKLSIEEKHLFTSVFATLTTSDICIQRNLAICVYEAIAAPEISCFIGNQIKEEVIHSITYQYVIEHLGLDEDFIYNLYKNIPEIAQKFELASFYSRFLTDYQKKKDVNDLLIGLIFYYLCFEGGWFYNGFSPIFALKRKGFMLGASEQLQYIMRDEAQHTIFGSILLKNLLKETDHKITQHTIDSIFKDAVKAEEIYSKYAIPTITGYSADMHIGQLKYLLNRRAKAIGFEKVFPDAVNELPWLDEMINIRKEANFFETKVTEYQTGTGAFKDFENSGIDSVLNWK